MKKMMINKTICTGCRNCEIMCSLAHSNVRQVNPQKTRVKIISDPQNGVDYPNICRQCAKPNCLEACTVGAISIVKELGCVKIDYDKCTGCLQCQSACPFSAVQIDVDTKLPLICDLCGGDPECVKGCLILPHVGYCSLNYVEPSEWVTRKTPSKK